MPAKHGTGGLDAADIEAALPKRYFITRGAIQQAFGFSKQETAALIAKGIFVAKYPLGRERRRARFVRQQIIEVARAWTAGGWSPFSRVQPSKQDEQ